MVTSPPASRGTVRRALEHATWITDLVAYAAIFTIGVGLVVSPPVSIQLTMARQPVLPAILAAFFLLGGGGGFAVRLLKLGLFERPAIWLAGGGFVLFGANAGFAAGIAAYPATVTIAFSVALVALFTRRILELQIFALEATRPDGGPYAWPSS